MAFDRSLGEDKLDLDQIQGDVLVGLQKDFEIFLGFHIAQVAPFKVALKKLAPEITTARKVYERELLLRLKKEAQSPIKFNFIGVNIGFTFAGLQALGVATPQNIADTSFKAGLVARSPTLGDPLTGPGAPANWALGGDPGLHGLVLVTGPDEASTLAKVVELELNFGASWTLRKEFGKTRQVHRGHEHFGYLDGVSQPAVRGQIDHLFPSEKFLNPSLNRNDDGQGLPGADLHWPGEFVFGYPKQNPTDVDPRGVVANGGLPWMKNGTFMVFRKLKQFVPEFDSTVDAAAKARNMDAALLGARMVGRWKSGAPVELSPLQDNSAQGGDEMLNNDFEFGGDDDPPRRCPFAAHIRKSYPRDDLTPAATGASDFEKRELSEADTQTHRIMRRGIPFGEELSDAEEEQAKTLQDRGLMFVCYQTSIQQQFEFIIQNWVNNRSFPKAGVGEDPILGQHAPSSANRARTFAGAAVNYPNGAAGTATNLPADFIVPVGGGYFFVPSIDALQTVLS